jgi:aminoglycoside phosphotransferase (APT) family kinase protein
MSDPALGTIIASGNVSEVFAYGPMVVKLYKSSAAAKRSAFREAAILALVESLELPVPHVRGVQQFGERWGVLMDRFCGSTFGVAVTRQPELLPAYLKAMVALQLRVHGHLGTQLASLKARLANNIKQATMLGKMRQTELLHDLAMLPGGDRLCHGDFHPLNILGVPGNETLIDWLDATRGDPAADVCRSYVLMKHAAPEVASAYVDAYAGACGETRENILRWLPVVAAARLAEGVPDEVDELMRMALKDAAQGC